MPGARLVVLDSANHILLADEPAWEQFLYELREFLGTSTAPAASALFDALSPRELEVLRLVAAGLTNEAIAERLVLSVRTVERHLSTIYAKLRLSGKAARAAAAVVFIENRAATGRLAR
ncbi:MAG: helix-turn-helix transcriptional regulator [Solirubrobacterales bacterium]|nr:helix-turn-helix transcriptional regulator [Solirubrobacterales bacterium]